MNRVAAADMYSIDSGEDLEELISQVRYQWTYDQVPRRDYLFIPPLHAGII